MSLSDSDNANALGTLRRAFESSLNAHGHGFQYRVLRDCDGIRSTGADSGVWRVLGYEVPVQSNGKDLHIDGVLQFASDWSKTQLLAIVETKRVNPSLGSWCFAGLRDSDQLTDYVYDDFSSTLAPAARLYHVFGPGAPVVQVGLELKSPSHRGDNGVGRSLDDAITQSLRGTAAFVESLAIWTSGGPVRVQPIIVTTASLHVTDTPLPTADLFTGNLELKDLRQVPWVWFRTHASRSLTPRVRRPHMQPSINRPMEYRLAHESRRAIAIISASSLSEGLRGLAGSSLSPAE